jgi:GABA permease
MASRLMARIALFYVLSVLLIIAVVPWQDIVPGISPFGTTLQHVGFRWAVVATKLIVLTAVLSCLNSALYVCSRTLFTLAAHNDAAQWLVGLNARRTPARAVSLSAAAGSMAIGLAAVSAQHAFAFLVNASGAIILAVYVSVCWAYLRMRRSSPEGAQWRLAPFPAIAYVPVAGVLLILGEMAASKQMASQLYASIVPLAAACAAYGILRYRRRPMRSIGAGDSI